MLPRISIISISEIYIINVHTDRNNTQKGSDIMNKVIIIIDILSVLKYAKKSSFATLTEMISQCSNEISIDEIDIDE
jgi:hypothetical protein